MENNSRRSLAILNCSPYSLEIPPFKGISKTTQTSASVPTQRTVTVKDLCFYSLVHLFKFLSLREIMMCESLSPTFAEAAKFTYRTYYSEEVTLHCGMVRTRDRISRRTLTNSPYENTLKLCGRMYWFFEMIARIGQHVKILSVELHDFTANECKQLCKVIVEHCTALDEVQFVGPHDDCPPEYLEDAMFPFDRVYFSGYGDMQMNQYIGDKHMYEYFYGSKDKKPAFDFTGSNPTCE